MNAALLQQSATHLRRQTRRWDRRLRLAISLVWAPRALIAGLLAGAALGVASRLRDWLLPEQILMATVGVCAISLLGVLGGIWLWPRTVAGRARYFDQRFDLKERVSTALELAAGRLPLPEALVEHQMDDAVASARRVSLRSSLPLRVVWRDLLLMVALAVALAYLLLAENPRTAERLAQRALDAAIAQQSAALSQAIDRVEADALLSEEERAALTEALQEAQSVLEQPNISQEEAVAALAGAGQALNELTDGMMPQQDSAYREAASELAGSKLTSNLAQALREPDLGQAAEAADDLAEDVGEDALAAAEREALAERLENAADEVSGDNPALAEKLREAAQALREGNAQEARQALEEAAELMRRQQALLEDSALAQAALGAAEDVRSAQRELAEAGQDVPERPAGILAETEAGPQQPGQMQSQQPGLADAESAQAGAGQEDQREASGESDAAPEAAARGEATSGNDALESEAAGGIEAGDGQGQTSGQAGEGEPLPGGENAPRAGSSEGGAGADTTEGEAGAGPGDVPEGGTAEGDFQSYTPENAPSTLGGQSDDILDLSAPPQLSEGAPVREGDFGPNPQGDSTLSLRRLVARYQDIVSDALESGRIPLDQRDVIHDYFSSLNR